MAESGRTRGPDEVYCTNCGAVISRSTNFCINCGAATEAESAPSPARQPSMRASPPLQSVPNYLVWAILATVFCCMPLGVVAIVHAAQVNGKWQAADYDGAIETSNKAGTWCWVSFWVGLAPLIIWVLVVVFAIVFAAGGSIAA